MASKDWHTTKLKLNNSQIIDKIFYKKNTNSEIYNVNKNMQLIKSACKTDKILNVEKSVFVRPIY